MTQKVKLIDGLIVDEARRNVIPTTKAVRCQTNFWKDESWMKWMVEARAHHCQRRQHLKQMIERGHQKSSDIQEEIVWNDLEMERMEKEAKRLAERSARYLVQVIDQSGEATTVAQFESQSDANNEAFAIANYIQKNECYADLSIND